MELTPQGLTYLLIFVRMSCFFVSAPIFSASTVPALVKLIFIWSLSFFVYQSSLIASISFELTAFNLVTSVVSECLVGLSLGAGTMIVFLAIQAAGDLLDTVAGLKMSSVYDPLSGSNSTLYSNLYNWIGIILFFSMNGHQYLIRGLVNSFLYIPVASVGQFEFNLPLILNLVTTQFITTIQLALPVATILFLIDVLLGILAKAIPQINVFILGMPLKLVVSFYIVFSLSQSLLQSMGGALETVLEGLSQMIQTLF